MAEKRLIDANDLAEQMAANFEQWVYDGVDSVECQIVLDTISEAPTVDAVEVPDKDLLKAIKLLIKQYERSKQSGYVHSPVAHALYRTWKQMDERREGECKIYLHPQKYTC